MVIPLRQPTEETTMTGYCGLICEKCEAFIATRDNDDALRREVAEKWGRLSHAPIKPEHINCTGCRSAGVKTYYCEQLCEVRKWRGAEGGGHLRGLRGLSVRRAR
jgi:hypothetical protein